MRLGGEKLSRSSILKPSIKEEQTLCAVFRKKPNQSWNGNWKPKHNTLDEIPHGKSWYKNHPNDMIKTGWFFCLFALLMIPLIYILLSLPRFIYCRFNLFHLFSPTINFHGLKSRTNDEKWGPASEFYTLGKLYLKDRWRKFIKDKNSDHVEVVKNMCQLIR